MDNMTLHNMVKTGGDDSEYIELVNTYKQQAQTEKARADEATERAETAETQAETAQAEKVEAQERAETAENNFAGMIDRSLTEITIPKEVTTIGKYGLSSFANLTKINFNEGLKKIGYGAISHCLGLTELVLPESLEEMGENAFSGSINLKSIIIPKNVIVWSGALANSAIETVIVEKGMTILPPRCCTSSSLKTVNLPNTIISISDKSFYACTALEIISVEEGFKLYTTINLASAKNLTLNSAKNLLIALENYSGTSKEFVNSIIFNATVWELLNAEGETSPDGTTWEIYVDSKCWNI